LILVLAVTVDVIISQTSRWFYEKHCKAFDTFVTAAACLGCRSKSACDAAYSSRSSILQRVGLSSSGSRSNTRSNTRKTNNGSQSHAAPPTLAAAVMWV
jgi:hypothetical protein